MKRDERQHMFTPHYAGIEIPSREAVSALHYHSFARYVNSMYPKGMMHFEGTKSQNEGEQLWVGGGTAKKCAFRN